MLKKYKNQLATYISTCGLSVHELEISILNELDLKIEHLPTNFFFEIHQVSNDFDSFDCRYTEFSPNFPLSGYHPKNYTSFGDILTLFDWWIKHQLMLHLKELDTPDFLELLSNNKTLFSPTTLDFKNNAKFNLEERKLLSLGLSEIKSLMAESFDFTTSQLSIINERISYVEDAANRLGKLDWKNILISTVFSMIVTLSLDTAKGQMLWDLFSKVLDNLPQLPIHQ